MKCSSRSSRSELSDHWPIPSFKRQTLNTQLNFSGPTETMPCKQFPAGQAESGCCSSKMLGFHGCGGCGVTFSGGFRLPQEWHKEWGFTQKRNRKQRNRKERERERNNPMYQNQVAGGSGGFVKMLFFHPKHIQKCGEDPNWLTHWFLVRFSPAGLGTRKRRDPKMSWSFKIGLCYRNMRYMYIWKHTHIYTHTHTYIYIYIYMKAYIYMYEYICMYIYDMIIWYHLRASFAFILDIPSLPTIPGSPRTPIPCPSEVCAPWMPWIMMNVLYWHILHVAWNMLKYLMILNHSKST